MVTMIKLRVKGRVVLDYLLEPAVVAALSTMGPAQHQGTTERIGTAMHQDCAGTDVTC